MAPERSGNSHGWRNLQTLLLVGTLGFLVVEKVIMPSVNSGKLAEKIQIQAEDVAVLKDVVFTLRYLPAEVSGIKATLKSVETTVERIEINFNKHVDKGK